MVTRSILVAWILLIFSCYAHAADFSSRPEVIEFIKVMVKKHKFKEKELLAIFKTVKIRPSVIQKVRKPFESNPWHTYQMLFITDSRIQQGVEFWKKFEDSLSRAEKIYGVPASVIVATIGVETKYGSNKGEYRVIDALVNLGFSKSPRAAFFKNELEEFLLLTREQHLNPLEVLGSYAGAIGQPQFMPSSYRHYAVNFAGNAKIDLSNNEIDVIGSIANYYFKHGWLTNKPIVIPASLQNNKYQFMTSDKSQTFSQLDLAKYGLLSKNNLLNEKETSLIELQCTYGKQYWIGFHNFEVIKKYNRSSLYAMAVYQLSYYISMLREKVSVKHPFSKTC